MKRNWIHPEEPQNAKRYWRSVSELERRESFLKDLGREFPAGDALTDEERENGRRDFLKIMGASVGLMGLASCRRPLTTILPYTQHVEWMVPGKALMYATTMPRSPNGTCAGGGVGTDGDARVRRQLACKERPCVSV
jgi:molybdopterin-containing oxidoreductase family iron-sulfur binding subunit